MEKIINDLIIHFKRELEFEGKLTYEEVKLQAAFDYPFCKRALKSSIVNFLKDHKTFDDFDFKELIALANGYLSFGLFKSDVDKYHLEKNKITELISSAIKNKNYSLLSDAKTKSLQIKEKEDSQLIETLFLFFTGQIKRSTQCEMEIKKNEVEIKEWAKKTYYKSMLIRWTGNHCAHFDHEYNQIMNQSFEDMWNVILGSFHPPLKSLGMPYDIPGPGPYTVNTEFKFHVTRVLNCLAPVVKLDTELQTQVCNWWDNVEADFEPIPLID